MSTASTYNQTLNFLYRQLPMYQREGVSAFKKNLDNIYALLELLDQPHKDLNVIHIAGTNGKGSVTHMMASILQEMGYSVGCYTSPHYKDFRERIKINGSFIPESYVISFVDKIKPHLGIIKASFFELTVAMAFDYFEDQSPDFCIIETGLGGRLDSTNVVNPLLSIITNISLDHQDMLGDTLEQIATEKAGIIKESTPVLIGEFQKEIHHVFIEKAVLMNSDLRLAEDYREEYSTLISSEPLNIEPEYFRKNKLSSVASILRLYELGLIDHPTDVHIKHGLASIHKNTYYVGRNMVLNTAPLTIADSGHNEAGVISIMEYIKGIQYDKLHIICGFVKDKQLQDIIEYFPKEANYYFTQADVPRAMPADELANYFKHYDFNGEAFNNSHEALHYANELANKEDLILICGSIFLVAELI